MSINSRLKQAISSLIAGSIDPGYASDSKTSELYERYIFEIILGAAKNEGASIFYLDTFGNQPQSLLFRESPGQIYATDKPYTYSIIEFPGKPLLEVHVGVRVQGVSQVSHECDVCVLYQEEANRCRVERQEPDCSRIVIAVECKHYESELNLDLARSFIGLTSELQVEGDCYFVSNTNSTSVAKLLAIRRLKWEQNMTPGSRNNVNRLRYAFQSNFKDFKARYGI
ncbi:hypothetical protein WA1_24675 [Scytonema hofmannii PCC 7110]|uniref:Uncharacterized protein n=1 Tax=Scytonema hofmannii PCC 7110 TaxID=128403 RepID=A0A139X7Y7_9CYAN|nr:hypothetical protein [Scytonema hofmannii]KYC40821.1 hypothetical protein WA1_24675 [Scytonema hofmannii PCC 7110]